MSYETFIHRYAEVHHTVLIGNRSRIYQFATILEGTQLGEGCIIGACTFVGPHCQIGQGTRMHTGAQIPGNTVIGAYVFLGPNAVLTDALRPCLEAKETEDHRPPVIEDGASIGANSVILPGVVVGRGAIIGAGTIVTRDVPPGVTVRGNPGRMYRRGLLLHSGERVEVPGV